MPGATGRFCDSSRLREVPAPPTRTSDRWIAALVLEHGLALYSRDAYFSALPQLSLV